ncbi:V-type ATP synthase subunit E [Caproiciproducens sp. LBM24188]
MANNEEKINKFNLAINHYAEEQRKKIEQEIAEFKQKELEDAEVEALTEAYRLIHKEMSEMRNGIAKEMARREMDGRRELLEQRKRITAGVFEKAKQQLIQFTEKEEYAALLQKFTAKLPAKLHRPGTVIEIRQEDEKYEEMIKSTFGSDCTIKVEPGIKIGGIRAYNSEIGILADETLDSMLEDQREWFEENSGMTVV